MAHQFRIDLPFFLRGALWVSPLTLGTRNHLGPVEMEKMAFLDVLQPRRIFAESVQRSAKFCGDLQRMTLLYTETQIIQGRGGEETMSTGHPLKGFSEGKQRAQLETTDHLQVFSHVYRKWRQFYFPLHSSPSGSQQGLKQFHTKEQRNY